MSSGTRGEVLRTTVKYVVFIVALVGFMIWAGGFLSNKIKPGVVDHEPGVPLPDGGAIHSVVAERIRPQIDVTGTVVSERNIQLSARINGYVEEVLISAGEAVTNGQSLIVLDSREVVEEYIAAEAQFQEAELAFERTTQLRASDSATEQDLDSARARFTASRARLDQVEVMRSYAHITSPIDGVVADRRIEAGDLAVPGTVLLTVYDPHNMRLEVPVPIRLVDNVALDQEMDVLMDYPSRTVKGVVTEILGEIDPSSRTRTVKVHLPDDTQALPGTFGRLRVSHQTRAALLIPAAAVQRTGQLESVGLVRDDRVLRRLVKTIPGPGQNREVLSGLQAGDAVLLPPHPEPAHEI